ncbi:MAG: sialidase family protein [Minicystis sp.]
MRASLYAAGLAFLTCAALSSIGCGGGEATGTGGTTNNTTSTGGSGGTGGGLPSEYVHPWLSDTKILVSGETTNNHDCRAEICRHSENTDLITWQGAIWLVHRTAESQILGPNSSLQIYKSTDGGATFARTAVLPAVNDRDIRDPHFFVVGSKLYIKTLSRLPVTSKRDSDVDTVALVSSTSDGVTWSELKQAGPNTWSFWRIREQGGTYYSAAYEDGDKSVSLFSSKDGETWTKGAAVYSVAEDTPLETELTFMPSGKLLALVRMDGTDDELLGDIGRLRTKICWADAPYDTFTCPDEINGQRLDGPLSFFHDGRLFMVARKHLGADQRKRTSLFEITGDFATGGKIDIKEWGELPSAGDTSYAGAADIDKDRVLVTWYSGNLDKDAAWLFAMLDVTDIWQGTIDFSKLK